MRYCFWLSILVGSEGRAVWGACTRSSPLCSFTPQGEDLMCVLPSLPSLVTHLGITEMDTGVGLNSQWTHCELNSISYFIPICLTLQGGVYAITSGLWVSVSNETQCPTVLEIACYSLFLVWSFLSPWPLVSRAKTKSLPCICIMVFQDPSSWGPALSLNEWVPSWKTGPGSETWQWIMTFYWGNCLHPWFLLIV